MFNPEMKIMLKSVLSQSLNSQISNCFGSIELFFKICEFVSFCYEY